MKKEKSKKARLSNEKARKLKLSKKGELSVTWIVTIVLLLVGFGILLFLLLRFAWSEQADRQVCHESVVFRGTASALSGLAENYVPLKCKTAKFCITTGLIGGKCDGKGDAFYGEKGISKVKVKSKEDIERFIAREMVDCWNMMGEGKVSLFTQYWANTYGVGGVYPTCVLCSRIAYDKEDLKDAGINLEDIDVWGYMQTHQVPEKDVSYIGYFGGTISVADEFEVQEIKEEKGKTVEDKKGVDTIKYSEDKKEPEELSVLFMQISAPSNSGVVKNTLTSVGISYGASFVLFPKLLTAVTGVALSKIGLALAVTFGVYQQANVAYNRAVTAGYCGDVLLGNEARQGCSVIRTIDYKAEDISQYCSAIESIP